MMKKFLFPALGFALLWLAACNNVDAELVDKVQGSLKKSQDLQPGIESTLKDITNLQEQMSAAPTGVRNSADFGYYDLANKVDAFKQKFEATKAALAEINGKLEGVLGDYTDGKIEKEAVQKEQADLAAQIDGIQSSLDRMSPFFNQLSADYAKMMANWNALPEAEQLARSGPAPAALPSGALSGGASQPTQATRPQTSNSLVLPQGGKKE